MEFNQLRQTRNEFGKKVRYYRRLKNMTQNQLSVEIDRTEETISNIERGVTSTSIDVICLIANALDVKVIDLFNDTQYINPYLDKEKNFLANEIMALITPKSKKYLKALQIVLKEL